MILSILFLTACSGGNITEVGNPTVTATTAGTTAALVDSISGLLGEFSETLNPPALVKTASDPQTCAYNTTTRALDCPCEISGTRSQTFENSFTIEGNTLTFDQDFTNTFTNCVVSACSENFTLNGELTGNISGTFNSDTEATNLTITYATSSACSGMTANSADAGFDLTLTYDGTNQTFSGSFCIDGVSVPIETSCE